MKSWCFLSRLSVFSCVALLVGCTWRSQAPAPGSQIVGGAAFHAYVSSRSQSASELDSVYVPWVAALPFHDDSGFRQGVFELPNDIPRMLGGALEEGQICRVVPAEVVKELVAGRGHSWAEMHLSVLGDSLQVDYIISGVVLDYNFERLHLGDPLIGGYKSWEGTAEVAVALHSGAGFDRLNTSTARHESRNRGVGLDLLGKPREGDLHFVRLEEMEHGGPEFLETALGEATRLTIQQITTELLPVLQPRQLVGLDRVPTVLSVSGDDLFIDIGIEQGVQPGYRFAVEGVPGDASPIVEVEDVISANVSRVVALRGGELIRAGQALRHIAANRVDPQGR
ncbi:MAG: hypothetical protein VX528_13065 [Candidatus Latescibacterota bacterium]|nr:hypothetical protein [Candidatus Latescibacterota bacterium]